MKQLINEQLNGYDPYIGSWLWAMQDTRRRTLDLITELDDEIINWAGQEGHNSIGSLLYHLAAIEISWLYEDILEGARFAPEIDALMVYNVRNDEEELTPVTAESLDTHLNRLRVCREHFLSKLKGMTLEDFRRPRPFDAYAVTPEWVIHHLMQHEAEHRGQMGEIRIAAEEALGRK